MNKSICIPASILVFFMSMGSALACGGGKDIWLNDDTYIRDDGEAIVYPISDPENKDTFYIEKVVYEYYKCVRSSNNLGAALFGSACPDTTIDVFDSKGVNTHRVTALLDHGEEDIYMADGMNGEVFEAFHGNEATYIVVDLKTKERKVYKARLHTRGCGLEEVEK